jgi:hypothetical protein
MSVLGILALVLGILIFIALLFALILVPVSLRAKRIRAGLEQELGDRGKRVESVLGLGLESRGRGQVRGNGLLVLTADELRFEQLVPRRESRIPLADVTAVETTRSWLGKSVGAKLLFVRWRSPDGSEDAMAWRVRDLDAWLAALAAERD